MKCKTTLLFGMMASIAIAGGTNAAVIDKGGLITESETWTADNTYNLIDQVYVMPGATLTIEAGTLVASTPTPNGAGSLAITKGGKIIAKGTKRNPIIFTSTNDDFTTWREAANEWGNITVMGDAYIANSFIDGNSATCGDNVSPMEGLVADGPDDTKVLYGGTNDDDDSGCLEYVSIRYGGRVVGLANELNGLSLGGIGRATDINHIEIMNNVDDGVEIWGGTVCLKNISIWNIGDDSFDIDQGWRGCCQFLLIVQGYSLDADQGSGVGDNGCETDGAENSDAQPVTTAAIYNMTFIGQPLPGAGDGATAWRDNARVQYHQSIIMNCGEKVVRFDDLDGDGSQGYGFNGTLSWADTWTTDYDSAPAHANDCANPGAIYTAHTSGKLAQIVDTVFHQNPDGAAYDEANARGVFDASNDNVIDDVVQPIERIARAAPVVRGGKTMIRVTSLDPRARGAAMNSERTAPDNGFYTPVDYRGAFGPDEDDNWLCEWTAAFEYGFVQGPCADRVECQWDLDGDTFIAVGDLLTLLAQWGGPGSADFDNSGAVDIGDLLKLLAQWGPCPA